MRLSIDLVSKKKSADVGFFIENAPQGDREEFTQGAKPCKRGRRLQTSDAIKKKHTIIEKFTICEEFFMKAIAIEKAQGQPRLKLIDAPDPVGGEEDIVVSVKTAGVNRADLLRAVSHYGHGGGAAPAAIAGLEMAGEVISIGARVRKFSLGDRVMAMAPRSYAEKVAIHERLALRVPDLFNWNEAAAIAVSFLTAHDALKTNGNLSRGKSVMIQAVSSGAGIAGLQVAQALEAGMIAGTSGSDSKLARLRDLGLSIAINSKTENVVERINAATGNRGVDVIMDNIGKGVLMQNVEAAAVCGRIIQVGRLGGYVDEINLDELARKRLQLIGVTFRTRTLDEHAEIVQKFEDEMYPILSKGRVRPLIDKVFDLDAAEQAQEYMRTNAHLGKVVLRVA